MYGLFNYMYLNGLIQAIKGKSPNHLSKPQAFIVQLDIFYFEIWPLHYRLALVYNTILFFFKSGIALIHVSGVNVNNSAYYSNCLLCFIKYLS